MNFPFGAPVTTLRQQPIEAANVFVLGVYASAVHARWVAPDKKTTLVTALAIASEPCIFWRGDDEAEIKRIIDSIPVPAEAGVLAPAARNMNGPSGVALDDRYLSPLGLTRDSAWLCDLLPESRQNAGQARAVAKAYAPLVEKLRLPTVSVPPVPTRFADDERVEKIIEELFSSGATTLMTLGDKPLREFVERLQLMNKPSIAAFGRTDAEYGRRHPFTLRGRKFELLPLVHPRQAGGLGGHAPALRQLHDSWVSRMKKRLSHHL